MLFSMSNNDWTEIKMMFNAVDKSLIKLHRKRHPKCMAYPNLVSRRPWEGDSGAPVNPELQSGTASPPGLKKNSEKQVKHGQRVCVRIVGQGIMVAQGHTPAMRRLGSRKISKVYWPTNCPR